VSALAGTPIAINATPLLSPRTGIGQYTFHLVRELQALLPEPPHLFYAGSWTRELRIAPAPSAGVRQSLNHFVPNAYKLSRFLQQMRFSTGVRAHGIGLYHEPNFVAFRFDGPMVVTVHDLSWIRYPEMHPRERVKLMDETMPRVVRDAAQIIVDSEFVRGEVISHYGLDPRRVTAVPNGVNSDFHPRDAAECASVLAAMGLRHGEYVLTVGTLEPRKNLATAVAAFESLPQALRRRFPLVVVGMSGWGRERLPPALRAMADAGEARITGYLPQEELPMLYAGARLFLYLSVYEGFGLPPLEAMASGVPSIVSRRASLPEVVGDAARLVDPLDERAIAELLAALLDDDRARESMRAAGLLQATRFSWRACAERTLAIYKRAAA
jgi:glycosyltransferase involved in cell wall biosynthesis